MQHKTQPPVRFAITEQIRDAAEAWVDQASLYPGDYLFPDRVPGSPTSRPASIPGCKTLGDDDR
jgi:hypothetical protein